jgi:hypothetical protein
MSGIGSGESVEIDGSAGPAAGSDASSAHPASSTVASAAASAAAAVLPVRMRPR